MAFAEEAIRLAVVNAGLLGLIAAPTFPVLRDTTQLAFFEILEQNDIPHTYHKQENMVTLSDFGSQIIFRSLEHPERLRGTNLAWFGVDELTYCKEQGFLRLQARLRHPLAKELCGFAAWTPKGFDWVYKRFVGPEALPGYTAIVAQPYENRHLRGDFYSDLMESYDPKFAAQEVLGQYLNTGSGQAYHAFSRASNVRAMKYVASQQLCWSLDFNVDWASSVIVQMEELAMDRMEALNGKRRRSLNVIDEVVLESNASTLSACDAFRDKVSAMVGNRWPVSLRVYGDASGGARHSSGASDYEIIREFFRADGRFKVSYHVKGKNPFVRDRVNAVNSALCNAIGEHRLFIDPKCKRLLGDLEEVTWKGSDLNKDNPKLTHISDALGYLVEVEMGLHSAGGPRSGYVA